MEKLAYYSELLESGKICYKGTKRPVIVNSCSIRGLSLELAVKDYYNLPLDISAVRGIDIIINVNGKRTFCEVKSNGSPLANAVEKSSIILYAFYVDLDKTLNEQYGYGISKKAFIEIGTALGHIKQGTTSGGKHTCLKTQTVWNNLHNCPHGAKLYKLEDAYLANGGTSFKELFH